MLSVQGLILIPEKKIFFLDFFFCLCSFYDFGSAKLLTTINPIVIFLMRINNRPKYITVCKKTQIHTSIKHVKISFFFLYCPFYLHNSISWSCDLL